MSMKDVRLANLLVLLEEEAGVKAALARRIKKSPAQLSQWLSGYRTISEGTAREIERAAKKPAAWLDGPAITSPAAAQVAPPQLVDALPVVLDAVEGLGPSRWAAVRAVLDHVVTRPDLRDDAQAELLQLLSTAPAKRQTPSGRLKKAAVYTLPTAPALRHPSKTGGDPVDMWCGSSRRLRGPRANPRAPKSLARAIDLSFCAR